MDPLIKTEKIKVVYNQGQSNEYLALSDIDIEIYPQEYVIFFGPSGCGKSTLLYTILGLQKPAAGKVIIEGRDIHLFSEREKAYLSSDFYGIIFQNFNLIYSLNIIDNVALPQIFKSVTTKLRKERALKLLERFGIATKAYSLPGMLSGGQQQRVATCRALINNQKVLLADEPVGNLDSESAMTVMKTLLEINQQDKKTIVLVTHDANYLHFADRIYYFKDGKIDRCVLKDKRTKTMTDTSPASAQNGSQNEPDPKVRRMANYLLGKWQSHQAERVQTFLTQLLSASIHEREFYTLLIAPYVKGGAGLNHHTAMKYTIKIKKFLQVLHAYLVLQKNVPTPQRDAAIGELLINFIA